ncbi:hypothetical protein DPX16_18893 [Anabarilius grahami]|uniref:Uncharacterized protein n=1 Tax=Anabarilius grahami TaxID=495550 RepID=A0A3N0YLL6_ANAGA|nr:hypothetical protein DPX16_18893 [Anabarilius grahami]
MVSSKSSFDSHLSNMTAAPEPVHNMVATPEPSSNMAAMPEPSVSMAATPEPSVNMSIPPEPSVNMAATPETSVNMAATPESSAITDTTSVFTVIMNNASEASKIDEEKKSLSCSSPNPPAYRMDSQGDVRLGQGSDRLLGGVCWDEQWTSALMKPVGI